jgi:hypothetical protein
MNLNCSKRAALPFAFLLALARSLNLSATCASLCTNPADFVALQEAPRFGRVISVRPLLGEVGSDSVLHLIFDNDKMADHVNLEVHATFWKGTVETTIELPGFVRKIETPSASSASSSTIQYVYNFPKRDRTSTPELTVPSSVDLDLAVLDAADYDQLVIKVRNRTNDTELNYYLIPANFGWHTATTDSVMFIQRRSVSRADTLAGINAINFAPSPGVTYGGIYVPRSSGLLRILSPGLGLNMMFLDWKDSSTAFNPATGMYSSGTTSSTINFGLGVQVSLFNGILQATYGWNLQATKDRQYVGIGVSFVNLAKALPALGIGSSSAASKSSGK